MNKTETNAVIDAFMMALMTTSFNEIRLRAVAESANVSFAKLLGVFSSRLEIIEAFARRIDDEVLAGDDPDMVDEPPRERVFDVLMRRYDALLPRKLALLQLERDARRDPGLAMALMRIAGRSMMRMAAAADLDVDGARGAVVLAGLMGVHRRVLAVWLKEHDEGQALTMAELDKALRQAERRIGDLDRTVTMLRGEGGPTGGPLCRLRARMGRARRRDEPVGDEAADDAGDGAPQAA